MIERRFINPQLGILDTALPDAALALRNQIDVLVLNVDSVNNVKVISQVGQPIDGLTNKTVAPLTSTLFVSDGTTWKSLAGVGVTVPGAFFAGVSNLGNTLGTTGLVSNQLVLVGGNNVTLSQSSGAGGATVTISGAAAGAGGGVMIAAGTQTATSGTVIFSASNGIAFGMAGSATITASYTVPTVTNSSWSVSDALTSGTVGRLAFTNLNGVTLSLSSGVGGLHTIVGSHNGLTSQSTNYHALTIAGNTLGTSTFHATNNRSLFFNGGQNITLSGNGSTVTIIGQTIPGLGTTVSRVESVNVVGTNTNFAREDHQHAGLYQVSIVGNTAGATSAGAGSLVLAGGPNITLSGATAAGGMTVSVSAAAGGAPTISRFFNLGLLRDSATEPFEAGPSTNSGTMMIVPLHPMDVGFPGNMTLSTMLINLSLASANTSAQSWTFSFGIYTEANSTALSLLYIATTSVGNAASTNNTTGWHGIRYLSFHSSQFSNSASAATTPSFVFGSEYWIGMVGRTSGQTKGASYMGQFFLGTRQRSGTLGISTATATSNQGYPFMGVYSTSALPAVISRSSINAVNASADFVPGIIFENRISNY